MAIKDKLVSKVVLQQLKPLAISKYWLLIQQNILEALGGQKASEGSQVRLMSAIQAGTIQVWVALTADEERPTLVGMAFTRVIGDDLLGTRMLSIYGLNLKKILTDEEFSRCLGEIELYAKSIGCYAMHAQTVWSGVNKLLEKNGYVAGPSVLIKEI